MKVKGDSVSNRQGLQAIDRDTLTPLVRQALNSQNYEISQWDYQPVHGGAGDGGAGLSGVYRFAGEGQAQGQTQPWSLILKVIGSPAQGGDPQGGTRERLAYQSGVLNDLSGSFTAVRCFEVVERGEGVYWLWLEEIVDEMGSPWTLERHAVVARHLGQFNGAYLTEKPLPDWPWLSQDWLRTYIAPNAPAMAKLKDVLDHPLVRRRFPPDVAQGLFRLWAERELFLSALERLPQTLCHRDAFARNLFVRRDEAGREQTVAIDWAFTGIGAVGEEIVPLGLLRSLFQPAEAPVLDKMVFNGYLKGLHDAGWAGDPKVVRLAYTASAALRYGLGLVAGGVNRALNFDERQAVFVKQVFGGRSIEEVSDHFTELNRFVLTLADEARTLLDS